MIPLVEDVLFCFTAVFVWFEASFEVNMNDIVAKPIAIAPKMIKFFFMKWFI
jgi:hypothetical protein